MLWCMTIRIAQRFHPFSKEPGTCCLIPGTTYALQFFPTLIKVYDLAQSGWLLIREIPIESPSRFLVTMDLERGEVRFGKEVMYIEGVTPVPCGHVERLALGSHKKQEWELVRRRCDLAEILPIWFRLGQMVPQVATKLTGTAELLERGEFRKAFLAGFSGIMTPHLEDRMHYGYTEGDAQESSPLVLLTEGYKRIRKLFLVESDEIAILPELPTELHAGRMLGLKVSAGELDLEWSKKFIRRMQLRAEIDGVVKFSFAKGVKRMRVNGKVIGVDGVEVEKGSVYQFDRFET